MAHTIVNKEKMMLRIRRIKGQLSAIERGLGEEQDCSSILQTVAACRGALNGLMSELIEGHIAMHIIDPNKKPTAEQSRAAAELIQVVKTYLR